MAIHKLDLDEFDEIDYSLLAIHTPLDDFRLAFLINQKLLINLSKSEKEIQIHIKEGERKFSKFTFYDSENEVTWNLIQNKDEIIEQKKNNNLGLFSGIAIEISKKVFLLPEFKKVDYFLKIENNDTYFNLLTIQNLLKTIETISTVYAIDMDQIKSKNNLIF